MYSPAKSSAGLSTDPAWGRSSRPTLWDWQAWGEARVAVSEEPTAELLQQSFSVRIFKLEPVQQKNCQPHSAPLQLLQSWVKHQGGEDQMQVRVYQMTLLFGSGGCVSARPVTYRKGGLFLQQHPTSQPFKSSPDDTAAHQSGQALKTDSSGDTGSQLWHSFKSNMTPRSVYLEEHTLPSSPVTC